MLNCMGQDQVPQRLWNWRLVISFEGALEVVVKVIHRGLNDFL